jgi:hypothetical protein
MTDDSPKEEILINVTPREVRAALLENGILQEVTIERAARRGLISAPHFCMLPTYPATVAGRTATAMVTMTFRIFAS